MSRKSAVLRDLPLFPLPEVVLFPGSLLPLHIFEPRYRQMMADIMDGDRRFGVLNLNPVTREPFVVGCSAEVVDVEKLPDGRMNIITCGRERFRVLEFKRDRAYLIGSVEPVNDLDAGENLDDLVLKMRNLLKDVVHLSGKLQDRSVDFPEDVPEEAQALSFWIAGSFRDLPEEQQALLEMQRIAARLERQTEILQSACKQLAARTALKDAFAK